MHIKKYVANSIQEALSQIKKELGPQALILSVNNIKAKVGPLALMSPARVEVTAVIDEDPPADRYPESTLRQSDQESEDSGHWSGDSDQESGARSLYPASGASRPRSNNQYSGSRAQYPASGVPASGITVPGIPEPGITASSVPAPSIQYPVSSIRHQEYPASRDNDRPHSLIHLPDLQKVTQGARHMAQSMRDAFGSFRGTGSDHQESLHQSSVRKGKEGRGEEGRIDFGKGGEIREQNQHGHDRISSLCRLLEKIGLKEDIIEHIADVFSEQIPRSEDYSGLRLEGFARDILQQLVKTSGPIESNDQGPKYVALVGPTGTGKTTTIAKLSAENLLKRKKKVGLITIDTYRVGALEQLNTYAGIMNIPMTMASTFEQMRKAVLQYQDQDVVLIDTAGFSHHDQEHLQLLNAFLAQISNPEIHLVLSINTDERELINISQSFNLLHYERLLFTKLDESSYPGTIFNHMVYTGKPISYITTGQKVPEDIEVATPAGIINLMFQKKQFYASPTLFDGRQQGVEL
ncbi:MAG: flagellar biosynthesis protein FlhF [bacterium]